MFSKNIGMHILSEVKPGKLIVDNIEVAISPNKLVAPRHP